MDKYQACDYACEVLLKIGFEKRYQSKTTESRYFGWPGKEQLLRVSTHRFNGQMIGVPQVIANLTFADKRTREFKFGNMMDIAIGHYMRKSIEPVKATYSGPNKDNDRIKLEEAEND